MEPYKLKKQSSLPPWLEQNWMVVVILLGALALVGGILIFDFRAPPKEQTGPVIRAELGVVLGPVKSWEEGSTTRLKGVQLKIKNHGSVPADSVLISGVFRGVPLALRGKTVLMPGEIADYSVTFEIVVLNSDTMQFKLECSNCAPSVFPSN